MQFKSIALVLVPTLAVAGPGKPIPGDQHDPPIFIDEAASFVRVVSHGSDGYGLHAFVQFTGFASKTDMLRLDWKQNGKVVGTAKCVSEYGNLDSKVAGAECTYDGKPLTAKGAIDGELVYTDDQAEKEYLVRTFKVTVKTWKEIGSSTLWQIVPDDLLGAAWAYHYPGSTNALQGRPQLIFWASTTNHNIHGALRCTVGDAKLPDIKASLDSVHSAEEIEADHTPPKGAKQHYRWEHIKVVPELFFGEKGAKAGDRRFMIDNPGKWDCQLRVDGKAIRELVFTVDDKGMIQPDEMQTEKVHTLPGVVLVDIRIPKDAGFDTRIRPDAMKKSMGFGLPWPDHPKVKAMTFPPASGLPDP